MKCALMYICGSLEPGGPLEVLNLAHTDKGYTRIPTAVLQSPARLTAYIDELNLNTAKSVNHMLGMVSRDRCPRRHAVFAVHSHKWVVFPLSERWHYPHPSVEDAYRLRGRIESVSSFEHDDAPGRIKLLQEQCAEAMRVFLTQCANLQDEFAAGFIADADIAIEVAAARTQAHRELEQQLRQRQLRQ